MNKKNKKLETQREFLSKKIQDIKNRQNELMLKNVILGTRREELEFKYKVVERLISHTSEKYSIPKQTIELLSSNNSFQLDLSLN